MPLSGRLFARLAAEVELMELRTEVELITLDLMAGRTPPNMRRALFDHELDAGVNFADLQSTVDARAERISRRLVEDRARFAELLRADLAHAVDASPLAADRAISARLGDLLDPSRMVDPVAGTEALVADAERFHSAELAASLQEGIRRAVDEARMQGLIAPHLAGVPETVAARLDTLARRLAAAPHADVVGAARDVADRVAGTGLAGDAVLAQVDQAVGDLATGPLDNYARPAAQSAHNLGHQEAAANVAGTTRIYASELLDANTCGPCSLIDGHEYESEAEALADYPGGTYVDCEGGDRCRGTLVYVWVTEAPATPANPDGEPPEGAPTPGPTAPPYPVGAARRLPTPPSAPLEPLPPLPAEPIPAPAPFDVPVETAPTPAPEAPAAPEPAPAFQLPDQPVEAPYSADQLAQARRDLPAARAEVRAQAVGQRDEILGVLDRADATHLAAPPRAVAVRGPNGAVEYRRSGQGWDWFDALHPDEQKRLRRDGFWMRDGGLSPDELAAHWSERTGRELSTEEALAEWLEQTRRADALSALSRGRIINPSGYGGLEIDSLVDTPYRVTSLFANGVDDAAAHLAAVTVDLESSFAERAFIPAQLGPAPYTLSLEDFVAEVTRLEDVVADAVPIRSDEFETVFAPEVEAADRRLRELIPAGVEDPEHPLPLDQLHGMIVDLARKAGLAGA